MSQQLLDVIIPGLVVGSIYGLVGMAFAIVYKATQVVNFAIGEVMMLVAYIAFTIQSAYALDFGPLLLVTIAVSVATGLLIEWMVVRPIQGQSLFTIVMSTIGLAIVIRSLVAIIWGVLPQPTSLPATSQYIPVAGVGLSLAQIYAFIAFVVACILVGILFRYTRMGLHMRATASSKKTAQLIGINIRRVQTVAWVASTIVAGIAGVMIATIYNLGPDLYGFGLKSFPATILGGLDAVIGSAIGGIVIGVVENITGRFLGSTSKEIVGLLVIVFVLMVRPTGLFGQRRVSRP